LIFFWCTFLSAWKRVKHRGICNITIDSWKSALFHYWTDYILFLLQCNFPYKHAYVTIYCLHVRKGLMATITSRTYWVL